VRGGEREKTFSKRWGTVRNNRVECRTAFYKRVAVTLPSLKKHHPF